MTGRFRPLGAVLAAVLCLAAAAPAWADQLTAAKMVTNSDEDGPVGCEFLFALERQPDGGGPREVLHGDVGVLTAGGRWGALLKISLETGGRPPAAPDLLLMSLDGADNAREIGARIPTDDPKYSLFAFKPGPVTQDALAAFARIGVLTLLVTDGDGVQTTWTFDANSRPDLREDWSRCLAQFSQVPGRIGSGS